jgi:hypothetical protein
MRLRPAKTKTVFLLMVSLAFTAIGVGAIRTGQEIVGWFVALFFGLCPAAGASYVSPLAADPLG